MMLVMEPVCRVYLRPHITQSDCAIVLGCSNAETARQGARRLSPELETICIMMLHFKLLPMLNHQEGFPSPGPDPYRRDQ